MFNFIGILIVVLIFLSCSYRYLALGNLRDANVLMDEIKMQVEAKQLEFPKSDLMQFINFLLETYVHLSLFPYDQLNKLFPLFIE